MGEKETGSIRWFNNKKGYGFIQKDSDGKDIFCHYSSIVMEGYKSLKTRDKVSFSIVAGEKGPQSAEVTVIESAPETKTVVSE